MLNVEADDSAVLAVLDYRDIDDVLSNVVSKEDSRQDTHYI